MKMKRYIILLALGVLTLLPSCNKELDLPSDGRIPMDEIFTNRNRTRGYLNSCYGYLIPHSYIKDGLTDNAQDADAAAAPSGEGAPYVQWYEGSASSANYAAASNNVIWQSTYQGIRKCNVFLDRTAEPDFPIRPVEWQGWRGQAFTLRALYYLQLVQYFGDVPLVLHEVPTGYDFSQDAKAPFSTVIKQIIADCQSALEMSDLTAGGGFAWEVMVPGDEEIMWRPAAYAIMSRAITYAVSPRWNDGTFTKEYAAELTKEALDACLAHGLKLFDLQPQENNSQNAYAEYHVRRDADPMHSVDKETILDYGAGLDVWKMSGLLSMSANGQVRSGTCPSQELVDSYEMQGSGERPVIYGPDGYTTTHNGKNLNTLATDYDDQNPYEGRDPRFYASIYYNGALRYLDGRTDVVETYIGGTDGISATSRRATRTGYYLRKFNNWQSTRNDERDGRIRYFRLAELYLNFAECAYQSSYGPDGQVPTKVSGGQPMSAQQAVSVVRARAEMPPFPTGMTVQSFEDKLRNERRVEFAFEGHRWFDVRRWNILDETESYVSGMSIAKVGNSFTYTRISFPRKSSADKFYLVPVPQDEVDKMNKLTGTNWQNPGW